MVMASSRLLQHPCLLHSQQRLHFAHQNHCALLTRIPNPCPVLHARFPIFNLASFSVPLRNNTFRCSSKDDSAESAGSGLIRNAALVGIATLTCKILGLLREISLAAAFGIGPIATAFKYSWLVPGFASSLIGGVNGPIHVTMATTLRYSFYNQPPFAGIDVSDVLTAMVVEYNMLILGYSCMASKLPKERQQKLFQHSTAIMFMVGGIVGTLVFVFAESIIHMYAPGLWIIPEDQITREIAVAQLKIMIPCIVFAGPVGLGFGYMSAEGNNILPSYSPALSSIPIIASCVYFSIGQVRALGSGYSFYGALLVSFGASVGGFLQWIIQVIFCGTTSYISLPVSWVTIIKNKDVHKFFSLLLPATISSGMAQIASLTDLYFASLIPGAGPALSYSYLFAMAPLGILSSMILLPLLPTITTLAKDLSWPNLKGNLRRAILLCMVLVLPIFSTMSALAQPIIRFLFQRNMFDSSATTLVSSLFVCYSLGSPFYIIRELLIVVFYALGDGSQPFLVSIGAIALNAIMDWLFVTKFYLGAHGLALSTSFATAMSMIMLFFLLLRKSGAAGEVDYAEVFYTSSLLFSSCVVSGVAAFYTHQMLSKVLCFSVVHGFHLHYRIGEMVALWFGGLGGMIGFFLAPLFLHIFGVKHVRDLERTLRGQ